MPQAATVENSPRTVSAIITEANALEADNTRLNKAIKKNKERINELKAEMMHILREQGADKVSTSAGSAILAPKKITKQNDWDALYEFIKETGNWQLLYRRVSATAAHELQHILELSGETIPGLTCDEIEEVNFRKN